MKDDDRGLIWQALDAFENFIIRMLSGFVRFIFRKIPKWTYNFFDFLIPNIIKLVRVTLLAAVFLAVAIGPGYVAFVFKMPSVWLKTGMCMWSFAAIAGSIWGLIYLRNERRNLLKSMKNALAEEDDELV
jgi:hypothetical protein